MKCNARRVGKVVNMMFVDSRIQGIGPDSDRVILYLFVFLCWGFTAQSTTRSCRAGQLIVVLFLGRLRPSKRLISTCTKRGRPRQ